MSCGYSNRVFHCPFFFKDERRRVICEGGGCAFARQETYRYFLDNYCSNATSWTRCSLARALNLQYEWEEEAKAAGTWKKPEEDSMLDGRDKKPKRKARKPAAKANPSTKATAAKKTAKARTSA